MRIGIDIDGVLVDMGQYVLDYGSRFFYNNYKREIINIDKFEVCDIFDCSRRLHDEFWNKYFIEYIKNEPPRRFADEVINKLYQEGNEIYIITSRFYAEKELEEYEDLKETVINWLKKYNIYFDKVIFSPEDKTKICI